MFKSKVWVVALVVLSTSILFTLTMAGSAYGATEDQQITLSWGPTADAADLGPEYIPATGTISNGTWGTWDETDDHFEEGDATMSTVLFTISAPSCAQDLFLSIVGTHGGTATGSTGFSDGGTVLIDDENNVMAGNGFPFVDDPVGTAPLVDLLDVPVDNGGVYRYYAGMNTDSGESWTDINLPQFATITYNSDTCSVDPVEEDNEEVAAAGASGELPETGSSNLYMAGAATLMILVGIGFVATTRRRQERIQ